MEDAVVRSLPPNSKAGAGRRLAARLIDGLILLVPMLVVTAPIAGGFMLGSATTDGGAIVAGIVATLIAYGYYVVSESTRGSTFGKDALGIEVLAEGGRPTLAQAAKRNLFMMVSAVPVIGGVAGAAIAIVIAITIGSDPRGQGIHDRWAGVVLDRD